MTSTELNRKCRPLIKAYRELFGYAPSPSEYACTSAEYLDALTKAVSEKKEISLYLQKRANHINGALD